MNTESDDELQKYLIILFIIGMAINAYFMVDGGRLFDRGNIAVSSGSQSAPQTQDSAYQPAPIPVPTEITTPNVAETNQQNSDSYTTNLVVERGQVTHIDIPLRYHLGCTWGYAPLDVRTDTHPDWITHDEIMAKGGNLELGEMNQWDEFRISANSDTDEVVINCTFTKLPPP